MKEKQTTYRNIAGFRCLRNIKRQTNDLYLVHCGQQQCPPGYTYDHKIPNEYHIHFILSGEGSLEINGAVYHLKADDIFLIPKNCPISYYAGAVKPWEYMWITFDGEMAGIYLEYAGLTEKSPVIHSVTPNQRYLPVIKRILDANQLTIANEIRRVGYLYEILTALIDARSVSRLSGKTRYDYSSDTYFDYAIQYISSNYGRTNVQDIAHYVGINRSYLASIFKKKLQVSPREYLIRYRLNAAEQLLISTPRSVQDIAEAVGYGNPLTFSKIFKQRYGASPKHFRDGKACSLNAE